MANENRNANQLQILNISDKQLYKNRKWRWYSDIQILYICITVTVALPSWGTPGTCLCTPLDTSKYCRQSLRPFCVTYKHQFPNIQFGVTVIIKIISQQLKLHVQDEVLLCISWSIRKKGIMEN